MESSDKDASGIKSLTSGVRVVPDIEVAIAVTINRDAIKPAIEDFDLGHLVQVCGVSAH